MHFCTDSKKSIKDIDNWLTSDSNIFFELSKEQSKVLRTLFMQLSQFEAFLNKSELEVSELLLIQLKYIDIECTKKLKLKNLLKISNEKFKEKSPLPLYKELLKKLETYKVENELVKPIGDLCIALDKEVNDEESTAKLLVRY